MNPSLPLASAAAIATLSIGCAPQGYPIAYAPGYSSAAAPTDPGPRAAPIAQCSYEPGAAPRVGSARSRAPEEIRIAPDQQAPTTTLVLDGGKLGHDPQIAVGDRFAIVYVAHRYKIVDRATGEIAAAEPGDEIPPESDFGHLFSPLWSPVDKRGAPNANNLNRLLRFDAGAVAIPCDEQDPLHSKSCVQEFYDTRIQWDPLRKRFWVESAARNHLWVCHGEATGDGDNGDDDDEIGGDDCDKKDRSPDQARRFITIAVSVSDDPRKGWHRYALTDDYADWPKMAVSDHYLVLGYIGSPNLYVFDADKLAAGNPDRGPVRVATLNARALGLKVLAPVTSHGPTGGFTFLVGVDGSSVVTPVALYDPDPQRAATPLLVRGPAVDVGVRFNPFEDNPIYRDGQLYLTRDERVGGSRHTALRQVHVVRLPTRPEGGASPRLWASADPSAGFLHFILGGREPYEPPSDLVSYEKPALDVNGRGDVVVVFARRGYQTSVPLPYEARYAILYHGEAQPRPSVLLKRGTDADTDLPDVDDNKKAGIDLAFAQTDPTDDWTVWVTHVWADASVRWFRQVAAAVRP